MARPWLAIAALGAACSGSAVAPEAPVAPPTLPAPPASTAPVAKAPAPAAPAAPAVVKPELRIETHDMPGVMQWLRAAQGKPLLVNCWATWCAPCVAELPDLVRGTRAFRERGGVVVGVAMEQLGSDVTTEQAVAKVTAKAKELGVDFTVLVCTEDDMAKIRKAFALEIGGFPQTLTYDRKGVLVQQHEGPADADEFTELARGAER